MKNTKETIEDIRANGYDIDFGTVFNHAFETYKKIALTAGVALLLIIILFTFVVVGIVVGIIGVGTSVEDMQQFNIANFSAVGIVIYSLVMIIIATLGSPFSAGLLKMARNASKKQEVSIGQVFDYYSAPFFKDIIFAALILSSFSTLVSVGLELVDYKFLGVFINLTVSFLTFLTIPLIVFGELKPMEAIQGSITLVSKQFFVILGLLIVAILFCMLGFFALCIGIIFTMPFINAITYSIYASIINDEENNNQIEENNENEIVLE